MKNPKSPPGKEYEELMRINIPNCPRGLTTTESRKLELALDKALPKIFETDEGKSILDSCKLPGERATIKYIIGFDPGKDFKADENCWLPEFWVSIIAANSDEPIETDENRKLFEKLGKDWLKSKARIAKRIEKNAGSVDVENEMLARGIPLRGTHFQKLMDLAFILCWCKKYLFLPPLCFWRYQAIADAFTGVFELKDKPLTAGGIEQWRRRWGLKKPSVILIRSYRFNANGKLVIN